MSKARTVIKEWLGGDKQVSGIDSLKTDVRRFITAVQESDAYAADSYAKEIKRDLFTILGYEA